MGPLGNNLFTGPARRGYKGPSPGSTNMKLITAVGFSGLTLLLGWGFGEMLKERELDEARQRAAEVQHSLNEYIRVLEGSVADITKEREDSQGLVAQREQQVKDLERQLAEMEGKLLNAAKQQAAVVQKRESEQRPARMLAEVLRTPEMKELVKQQNLAQLDMFYGGLFKKFQLTGAELEDFKKLLAERVQAEGEFSLQAMGGVSSSRDARAAQKALKDARDANDAKIRTFLNNEEDYLAYQSWEQSRPERMLLALGLSTFSGQGEPLSSAQEDQLVSAMLGARMRRSDVPDLTKPENLSPENLSVDSIARILGSYDAQAQEVVAAASVFLSPRQLEALKVMQQQQKTMQEAGLKMGAAMFGGGK